MSTIDMNSIVRISKGPKMDMIEFADRFGIDISNGFSMAIATANLLEKRGQLLVVETRSKEEQILDNAMEETAFQGVVDNLDAEEQAHKEQIRQQKLDNTERLKIRLAFVTTLASQKFQMWLAEKGITEVTEERKNGAIKLLIENITPQEYSAIATKYKAENAIDATLQATSKVLNGTTNAVNYGLSEIVAPTAKLAGEAGMNLGKGVFHTLIKTGAGLINSGAKAIVDTKVAIATDPECLRASSQLIDAKNNIRKQVNSKLNNYGTGSGIEILS